MSDKKWEELADEEVAISDEINEGGPVEENGTQEEVALAGVLEHPSYKELEAKLTQLEEELRLQADRAVRAAAEAENARRRASEDVRKARDYSNTEFARDLLAVGDSLEQALLLCAEHPVMKEGIELTAKQLNSTFERFSVKVFDPTGEKFDPTSHEAMTMIEDPKVESGKIITVFQKGYWINDRLLRPARVVVAK